MSSVSDDVATRMAQTHIEVRKNLSYNPQETNFRFRVLVLVVK